MDAAFSVVIMMMLVGLAGLNAISHPRNEDKVGVITDAIGVISFLLFAAGFIGVLGLLFIRVIFGAQ